MKELELTSNAALTDAVYETALNGSFLEVKLVAAVSYTHLDVYKRQPSEKKRLHHTI